MWLSIIPYRASWIVVRFCFRKENSRNQIKKSTQRDVDPPDTMSILQDSKLKKVLVGFLLSRMNSIKNVFFRDDLDLWTQLP
ncbi:hypothetical protein VNO77_22194 [Canavalia gladiata]|uniref:Uncharacterized protein n=1 Tax=Canavalia gladiata TaxID=3824 RepID=A0AAN9QE89_CANGL